MARPNRWRRGPRNAGSLVERPEQPWIRAPRCRNWNGYFRPIRTRESSLARQRASKWGEPIREEVIAGIQRGDPAAIEDGVLFLEVNPRYFRSGYFKASIASKLKRAPLTEEQRARLRQAILAAVHVNGPEFNEYARLAVVVADAEFLELVRQREPTNDGRPRERLRRILRLCSRPGNRH